MGNTFCRIGGLNCSVNFTGFEWGLLPENSVVVDVGGGIGTITMDIASKHQHLRYVVEDLPGVIEGGRTVSILEP